MSFDKVCIACGKFRESAKATGYCFDCRKKNVSLLENSDTLHQQPATDQQGHTNMTLTKHNDTDYGYGDYYIQKEGKQWVVSFCGKEIFFVTSLVKAKAEVKKHEKGEIQYCCYCGSSERNLRPATFYKGQFCCQSTEACQKQQREDDTLLKMQHDFEPETAPTNEEEITVEEVAKRSNLPVEVVKTWFPNLPTNEETSDMRHERMPHDVQLREETAMLDPRDTNNMADCSDTIRCSQCGIPDNESRKILATGALFVCCLNTSDIASDEEIADLARIYDTPHLWHGISKEDYRQLTQPLSDELEEKIATEVFAIQQQNTQLMVRVETLSGKQIGGVYPLELWLKKGFDIAPQQNCFQGETLLQRAWSDTDSDWLIAYHAQGGGA
jgi:hypothetical protein